MKIVLNQDVKGIGKKNQIVEVSEGYARNYLLPKKIAVIADNKNLSEAKGKQEALEYKRKEEIKKANEDKEKLEKVIIEFKEKQGTNGKLFGSVTEKEIAEKIKEKTGIEINKKKVSLNETIKQLGSYKAQVKLYEGINATVKIVVAAKN